MGFLVRHYTSYVGYFCRRHMEKNEYRYISNRYFWRDRTDANYGV